jgi:glycosyltransferase involved in cell wall biosynthesis
MLRSILLVGNFFTSSLGSPGVCTELAERLSNAEWNVTVTSKRIGRIPRLLDMVSTAWRKRKSFSVAQIDVYSGPAFLWAEIVCYVLRLIGKPYVLTLHGGNLPVFARTRRTRVSRVLGSAAVVTTPSRYLYEYMREYRGDLKLLPNALDLGAYNFRPRTKAFPRLLWLRAFHHVYNPALCIKTLNILVRDYPDISLTMIGPDKNDGSFAETFTLTEQLGLKKHITFQGSVRKEEVPKWLVFGDIFLNTSNVDNTPVTVLEAMASGLCIVSTDVGGIPYLLNDGENALLVPSGDANAMAEAVRSILTRPFLAEQLSRNARQAAEQFDWSRILPQWETLLRSVAHGGIT